MRISVITVSWNNAPTIRDTIRSVNEQTHPDLEHIVIDGGSTDETLAIVRSEGERVATLLSEPDAGIYDAMNKGLARASGDFVGFLNADDFFASKSSVASIATAASTRLESDAVYGDLVYVDPNEPQKVIRYWRAGPFTPRRLRYGWMPPHPTFYAKRSALQAFGGFDTSLRIAADYDLMTRCLTGPEADVIYLPSVLVNMRAGGVSNRSISSMLRKSSEDLEVMRRHKIGGLFTLLSKNVRKLPQFFASPRP